MPVLLDVIADRNDFYMYIFIPSRTGMKNMLCLRVVVQGRKRVADYSSETMFFVTFHMERESSAQHDSYEIPLYYYSSFFVTIQDFPCFPFWSNLMKWWPAERQLGDRALLEKEFSSALVLCERVCVCGAPLSVLSVSTFSPIWT